MIIPLLSNLHTWLMFSINWIQSPTSFLHSQAPKHTHTHTQSAFILTYPLSLSLSLQALFVSLFWRSLCLCRSKLNIWVSLYLVEQDLQDIVGRMCELEQFTLWESPIHTHTQWYTHAHKGGKRGTDMDAHTATHTQQFADIVPLCSTQCDFQVQQFMPDEYLWSTRDFF